MLKGITGLFLKKSIEDQSVAELVIFILFRIALPKMIEMNESFNDVCNKATNALGNKSSQFLRLILMGSIKTVDTASNIFSY